MIRVLLAVAAIGLMSLSAFAQPVSTGSPEQNEATRKATAERIKMGEKKCVGCDLFQVDLSYQDLPNRDLSSSRIRQADLSLATFDNGKFANANMSIVNAFGARFEDADFTNVNFQDATLVGAWFGGANFANANLSNANLSGAFLVTAKNLTQYQLNTACGDSTTELPKGLTLVACKIDVPLPPASPVSNAPAIEAAPAPPAPAIAEPAVAEPVAVQSAFVEPSPVAYSVAPVPSVTPSATPAVRAMPVTATESEDLLGGRPQ